MKSLAGLLVVALISILIYRMYFAQLQSAKTGTPVQTISGAGVKNDLIAIARPNECIRPSTVRMDRSPNCNPTAR